MQTKILGIGIIGVSLVALFPALLDGSREQIAQDSRASGVQIPKSLQVEHAAIHSKLVEATKAPGRVGATARELAGVLHPHFVREEEIALPPLGLIAPLAATARPAGMAEVLVMTETLRKELPRMLEEHKSIRAAVEKLRIAAREESAVEYEQLAEKLALHAQSEEEVFYPAALLVGEIIKARMQQR